MKHTLITEKERGLSMIGWLKSKHTFSFGRYYNPERMQFKNLRVINDDIVKPNYGFDTHGHQNMEIITYVLSGELNHKDSLGNIKSIKTNEFQVMSAGTGIEHSEFNASQKNDVHFLQIWIKPNVFNIKPNYNQISIEKNIQNENYLIASNDTNSPLFVNANADIYVSKYDENILKKFNSKNENLFIHLIEGQIKINDQILNQGDGISIENSFDIDIYALEKSHFLIFDLDI